MIRLTVRIGALAAIIVGQLYVLTAAALDDAFARRSLRWAVAWQLLGFGAALAVACAPPRCRKAGRVGESLAQAAAHMASR